MAAETLPAEPQYPEDAFLDDFDDWLSECLEPHPDQSTSTSGDVIVLSSQEDATQEQALVPAGPSLLDVLRSTARGCLEGAAEAFLVVKRKKTGGRAKGQEDPSIGEKLFMN